MNCKPGDLAVIVRSDASENIGKLVTVLRPHHTRQAVWFVEMHGNCVDARTNKPILAADPRTPWVHDICLRPIRDPGDDAMDEMLRPLPAGLQAVPA